MTYVIITGSSDGLGLMAARLLIEQGHEVVLHGAKRGSKSRRLCGGARRQGTRLWRPRHDRRRKNSCRRGQQARPLRRRDPQCRRRLPRGTGGNGARGFERLRRQCARPLHSDGTDRKTGMIGLPELRRASCACANGRSAVDQAILERLVGLRGLLSTGRSASGVRNAGLACHERGRVGAIHRGVFLSSTTACAEPDRSCAQDSGRVAGGMQAHLWHTSRLTRGRGPDAAVESDCPLPPLVRAASSERHWRGACLKADRRYGCIGEPKV